MVERVLCRGIDFVALPTREDLDTWHWTRFHLDVYEREEMRPSLNCVSILSARAVDLMLSRRRELGRARAAGEITFWPNNEVFMGTEIARAGYRFASLEEFGGTDSYEWHPPTYEGDLVEDVPGFVHPVLDQPRYIASVLRYEFEVTQFLLPWGRLWTDLRRFPAREWLPRMPGAFTDALHRMVLARTGHI